MRREPLFIRFANGLTEPEEIILSLLENVKHKKSIEIAKKSLDSPPDLNVFRRDFKRALTDLIDNGINNQFINYLDSYMKPSLLETVKDGDRNISERREIFLKAEDTPWIEAIVCYNLSLYLKIYGINELKKCAVCEKFFSNKGKYAKYCSETCKASGKK